MSPLIGQIESSCLESRPKLHIFSTTFLKIRLYMNNMKTSIIHYKHLLNSYGTENLHSIYRGRSRWKKLKRIKMDHAGDVNF